MKLEDVQSDAEIVKTSTFVEAAALVPLATSTGTLMAQTLVALIIKKSGKELSASLELTDDVIEL